MRWQQRHSRERLVLTMHKGRLRWTLSDCAEIRCVIDVMDGKRIFEALASIGEAQKSERPFFVIRSLIIKLRIARDALDS